MLLIIFHFEPNVPEISAFEQTKEHTFQLDNISKDTILKTI